MHLGQRARATSQSGMGMRLFFGGLYGRWANMRLCWAPTGTILLLLVCLSALRLHQLQSMRKQIANKFLSCPAVSLEDNASESNLLFIRLMLSFNHAQRLLILLKRLSLACRKSRAAQTSGLGFSSVTLKPYAGCHVFAVAYSG